MRRSTRMSIALAALAALIAAAPAGAAGGTRATAPSTGSFRRGDLAGPGALIYSQLDSGDTLGTVSQNYETALDSRDSQVADDFTIPGGESWTVMSVAVGGSYNPIPPPRFARSVNLFFYGTAGTTPGGLIRQVEALPIVGLDTGAFQTPVDPPLTLQPGTYWVSVQANLDNQPGNARWGWQRRLVQTGNPAVYQNPGNGFGTGCIAWAVRQMCDNPDSTSPDQTFALTGFKYSCLGKPATQVGTGGKEKLVGSGGADVLIGLGGNDKLIGKGGKDRVCAGGGNDTIKGGGGNDRIFGQGGRDRCLSGSGRDRFAACEVTK